MYRHLLVPIDGSERAERAVQASIGLAAKLGASITALIVEPPAPPPLPGHGAVGYVRRMEAHDRETAAHAERLIEAFRDRAERAGVPFEGCYARSHQVVASIVEAAVERGCDLIVMATHVHGVFAELFGTSSTKGVMARSELPLLVLH